MAENNKYICEKCQYGTNVKASYEKHLKTTLHLTGHKKSKKKIDIHKCDKCEYKNEHKYNYMAHQLNVHGTKEERKNKFKYYCEFCDIGTFAKTIYNNHVGSIRHKRNLETIDKNK